VGTAWDVVVVGGGIVGAATACALASPPHRRRVVLLEAETGLARHQSGRNSGVVHSGLPYAPGSLKARLAVAGRHALERFCAEEGVPYRRCGKVVVAVTPEELPRLDELERRGHANGLAGLARLGPEELREVEPHARGIAALRVPETGVVDFPAVVRALARRVEAAGGEVWTGAPLTGARRDGTGGPWTVETPRGTVRASWLVNCAGLQSDRVARRCGAAPDVRILPFRGDYFLLTPEAAGRVRHLVYPVPDPALPFLGVHFTRRIDGTVDCGPNAVPALARHGYRPWQVSPRDLAGTLAWPGTWRLAAGYWRLGLGETARAASRAAFARAASRLVPVYPQELVRAASGIRAQAVDRRGRLVDDFHLLAAPGAIHVLNAPSPAATAALAIGAEIAARLAHPRSSSPPSSPS
jgi:L-2-hydroxyglutarate oxidase